MYTENKYKSWDYCCAKGRLPHNFNYVVNVDSEIHIKLSFDCKIHNITRPMYVKVGTLV